MYIHFCPLKLYFKKPLTICSSASSSVKPKVISFINCSPAILPIAASWIRLASKWLAEISGTAESLYGEISVKIKFFKNDKKSVYINGLQVLKIGELFGNVKSVFFNPSELKLVQESPEDRRRFMNISLSQMSKNYFYALSRYNKILAQRNNLLKNKDVSLIKETLPVWDNNYPQKRLKL